jgi:hypothetical protein
MSDGSTGGNGKDPDGQVAATTGTAAQPPVVVAQIVVQNGQFGLMLTEAVVDKLGFSLALIGFLTQLAMQERDAAATKSKILRPTLAVPPLARRGKGR